MKARWQALAARIDALSQRERILALGAAAAVLVFAVQTIMLGPLARQEDRLRKQLRQDAQTVAGIDATIAEQARAHAVDPDRPLREQLQGVEVESNRLTDKLRTMERGLVAPERMAPLLEAMLRSNGRLRLVSMKTLPVTPLSAVMAETAAPTPAAPAAAPPAAPAIPPAAASVLAQAQLAGAPPAGQPAAPVQPAAPAAPELLYRHGVELTVSGGYLDLVDYMATLESLPTQLFWGKAQLDVEQHPTVRLTLTLYTLSLDDKWMTL